MKVVALNKFEICFALSKEQKPPVKIESLNWNSIEAKLIIVFTAIHLVARNLGQVTDHYSTLQQPIDYNFEQPFFNLKKKFV